MSIQKESADNTQARKAEYFVEVVNTSAQFRFRLVHPATNRRSGWANYTQVVMLDDMAACAGNYSGGPETELVPMHATEMLALIAVGADSDPDPLANEPIRRLKNCCVPTKVENVQSDYIKPE